MLDRKQYETDLQKAREAQIGKEKNMNIIIPPDAPPQRSRRYIQYRDNLINAGFSPAARQAGHFFRQATEKTAFVINLHDEEYGVSVLYGFASTSFVDGDDEWFINNGSDDDTCHVRNNVFICDEASENDAEKNISAFYIQYKDFTKDEILSLKKERQKAFLDHFAKALKPLGFKKQGMKWTRESGAGIALTFQAQKSAYSDQFYFNVIVHNATDLYRQKSFERVALCENDIYNWQLMTNEQTEKLVRYALERYIIPKIENSSDL